MRKPQLAKNRSRHQFAADDHHQAHPIGEPDREPPPTGSDKPLHALQKHRPSAALRTFPREPTSPPAQSAPPPQNSQSPLARRVAPRSRCPEIIRCRACSQSPIIATCSELSVRRSPDSRAASASAVSATPFSISLPSFMGIRMPSSPNFSNHLKQLATCLFAFGEKHVILSGAKDLSFLGFVVERNL